MMSGTQTSVLVTNGIFQSSGGMILQMPYAFASEEIDLIYVIGSLNSSTVGKNSGQSVSSKGRGGRGNCFVDRGNGVLTDDKSKNGATEIGVAFLNFSLKSSEKSMSSGPIDGDLA